MLLAKTSQMARLNPLVGAKTLQALVQPRLFLSYRTPILYAVKTESKPTKQQESQITERDLQQSLTGIKTPPVSFIQRVKQTFGYGFKYPQNRLKFSAVNIFLSIQYQVDYDKFFKKIDAPDVMNSYCLVTFFHVWLVSVALMRNDQSQVNYITGLELRKYLVKNMWTDIEARARKLSSGMTRKNSLRTYNNLNSTFNAFLFGFDEGLLGDDVTLAGAVWRHLFEMRDVKDYKALADVVEYIRKNVNHIESISEEDLFKNGVVTFIDFDQKEIDHTKVREKLIERLRKNVDIK